MKQSVDFGSDDHVGDEDRPQTMWSVSILDDCDTCDDIRVELVLEEQGRPGTGVVAHLAPATAVRLRAALASALRDAGAPDA
ncbi:MAG: hypothetical protein QOE35_3018 [Actinomycetota bacterium]|jgi:hypothetical protein